MEKYWGHKKVHLASLGVYWKHKVVGILPRGATPVKKKCPDVYVGGLKMYTF